MSKRLQAEWLYSRLKLIRHVEEKIAKIYPSDKIKSPVHLSIGQEAVAVGICAALRQSDYVSGTYRGHATYLAHGGALNEMMAELYGKFGGVCQGKGGSMHLADLSANILGCSAVVGTTVPIGLGYSMGRKMAGHDDVVAVFFGDGATEEGAFHESVNFAALHKLPVLFVCENNGYAIHTPLSKRWATEQLTERMATYGIPAEKLEIMNVQDIASKASNLVERARAGDGPGFLECMTYRWMEHVGPGQDYTAGYRSDTELAPWMACDEVDRLGAALDAGVREKIDRDIETRVAAAVAFAEESPFPGEQELLEDVYA